MQSKIVKPRTLSGFMELLPEQQICFDNMIETICKVFKRNNFLPINTPILELSDILLAKAGGETEKQLYRFSKGDNDLCMRFDLTVPLAKYVALYKNQLIFPFKRFQIGKCFRGERTQKGRFREFIQCDIDIIGDKELSILADAECISIIYQVYNKLQINNILIQISNRKILNGFVEYLGVSEKSKEIFGIIDKLFKMGQQQAEEMLKLIGLSNKQIKQLLDLVQNKGSNLQLIAKLKTLCNNNLFLEGIKELEELDFALKAMGVPENNYVFDLRIVRGLDYYTGTVFETIILGHEDFGSIAGGGRYDDLAGFYTTDKLPGVGASIGISRLFDLLSTNGKINIDKKTFADLVIIPIDNSTTLKALELANIMRDKDIICDVYYSDKPFKWKLNQANKTGVEFVIIIGEDEVKINKFTFKDMRAGTQENISLEDIINKLTNYKLIK